MRFPRLASFALPALLLLGPLGAAGCSSGPASPAEDLAWTGSDIISGKTSDTSQDAVVLLTNDVQGYECTATLLAPNLVLTARHCVSTLSTGSFSCDHTGTGTSGGDVGADWPADQIAVRVGLNRPVGNAAADAKGTKIFHDSATNLCNHDLALVLLDKAIPNAKIAPVRLDDTARPGEQFTSVGWGVTDQTTTPRVRQQRAGLKVVDVGPTVDTTLQVEVPPNDFVTGEDTCEGDSGGPAIHATSGAIIGIISAGGNGQQPDPNNIAAVCTGAGTVNFFTQTAPFKDLLLQAYAAAGQDPWPENGPDPRLAKTGAACAQGAECRGGLCLAQSDGTLACTSACSDSSACPAGYDCATAGGQKVCVVHVASGAAASGTSGCVAGSRSTPSRDDASWSIVAALAMAGAIARRRATR